MLKHLGSYSILALVLLFSAAPGWAQGGSSGSMEGVVKDSSGAVVAGATVEISYSVSGYSRMTTTGGDGAFRFTNVPFNTYHMIVSAPGFASHTEDVDVRSAVPAKVEISLKVGSAATTTVTVEANGGDLVENRVHVSHRRGPRTVRQASAGERIVFGEFAGYAFHSRSRRGFERPFSRTRRPRVQLVFRGRPAHHRSAKQGVLESDSGGFDSIPGSDFGRAAGRIWRQDEPGDCGDHAFRPRREPSRMGR